eukprot:765740-Hanusia_phi.AAC.1
MTALVYKNVSALLEREFLEDCQGLTKMHLSRMKSFMKKIEKENPRLNIDLSKLGSKNKEETRRYMKDILCDALRDKLRGNEQFADLLPKKKVQKELPKEDNKPVKKESPKEDNKPVEKKESPKEDNEHVEKKIKKKAQKKIEKKALPNKDKKLVDKKVEKKVDKESPKSDKSSEEKKKKVSITAAEMKKLMNTDLSELKRIREIMQKGVGNFTQDDVMILKEFIQKIKTDEQKQSPKKSSDKIMQDVKVDERYPIIKPKKTEKLPTIDISLQTKKADQSYLTNLRKIISEEENGGYNTDRFEQDINSDDFVKRALDAHIESLKYKLKNYKKLSKYNWQGYTTNGGGGFTVDINKKITELMQEIENELKEINENENAVKEKRMQLMNILYDPDNGIATIRGSSRNNIRISIIKLIYTFFKMPTFFFKGFINFMLTGSAGSGKTRVASVIAHTMRNLGILATRNVTFATKQNLIGEYSGQTGPKTRNVLVSSLEGVVFIDEAYTLTPCTGQKDDGYAEEAVGELINTLDKFIGCFVVIVAGYKEKMYDCFLAFNEGMARRFPKVMDLMPYDSDDLYEIFENFLSESIDVKKVLNREQRIYIKSIISILNKNDLFSNQAGDMLNLSKIMGEDALLNDDYTEQKIKLSFKKFAANKDIAILF